LGISLSWLNQHAESEALFREGLEHVRKARGEENVLTANWMAQVAVSLSHQRKFQEAAPLFQQALAIYRKTAGPESALTADCTYRIALDLGSQGKNVEAEAVFREALALFQKSVGDSYPDTVRCFNALGRSLDEQRKHSDAAPFHRQAVSLAPRVLGEANPETARFMTALAQNLINQSQFAEADSLYRQALVIFRKSLGDKHHDTVECEVQLAANQFYRGKGDEIGMSELVHYVDLISKFGGTPQIGALVRSFQVAVALRNRGRYEEADRVLRQALATSQETLGDQHLMTGFFQLSLAANLSDQDQYREAEGFARQALANFRQHFGEGNIVTASCSCMLAQYLIQLGQVAEAETEVEQALAVARRALGEEHATTSQCYLARAQLLWLQGRFAEAEDQVRSAINGFTAARVQAGFSGLERMAFAESFSPFPLAAALAARGGRADEAWRYLEQDLARSLLDDLAGRETGRLTSGERRRLQGLQERLAALNQKIQPSPASDTHQQEKLQLQAELARFQAELAVRYGPEAGQVYDIGRIQARLPAQAALVAWLDFDTSVKAADPRGDHWALILRRQGPPQAVRLTGGGPQGAWTHEDDERPVKFREALTRRTGDPRDLLIWKEQLARQRVAPLLPLLQGGPDQPPVRHLIVLPSPAMAGIPVDVLIESCSVSYAPSGTLFAWLQERQPPRTQDSRLLALGDPAFARPGSEPIGLLERAVRGDDFSPLPGSRREVEAIAGLFTQRGRPPELLLGAAASEEHLDDLARADQLSRFRYVHLATHGRADPQGGLQSFLALAPAPPPPPGAESKPYDGRLSAEEIQRHWRLDADLVTLSACESGLGQLQRAEGYVGFAQALFLAGARSLVLSLWKVNDRATALLMYRFYENLLERNIPKAAALAEARTWLANLHAADANRLLDRFADGARGPVDTHTPVVEGDRPYAHPYFWAAFILVGDPGDVLPGPPVLADAAPASQGPLEATSSWWPWLVTGAVVLAGALGLAGLLRRRWWHRSALG
jgi:CHAT domain-containing protein/tetratricopeptide (TPR) repeat protein